jgi:serine/threonine protein kinase/Tfp pilus assembly protein PilF
MLAPGTRVGPYEVLAPLGAGGMGEVWRARDPRLERDVAIKALPSAFAQNPERLARFEREARLLASLNHPNIAGIYGLEDADGTPCLVLELVEGEALSARLARGVLSARETIELGGQIAAAVEAAHARGIVHRDLKPGNVMLTPARMVKVLDFGLARGSASGAEEGSATVAPTMTAAGLVLGTTPYMSPEQARGKPLDARTDIWSTGCILYECLAGSAAFSGETASDIIGRILERDPDWNALPAHAPKRLRALVRRCLARDPAERPADMAEIRRELTAILQEISSGGSRPASSAAGTALPSLAVLYFENLATDKESEYFCAGITEDILTDLSKLRGLRVASRNAVARYRGAAVEPVRVAEELGVAAVLEGSVRRAGDRVRITAQLVNGVDGFHLWAERYDRTLEDVFAVQEEIAASIAAALKVALAPEDTAQIAAGRPDDVRAYDLFLKGRELYKKYTPESLREALACFEQAIAIDAGYARAWAGVGDCVGQLMQFGTEDERAEASARGLAAARRAIELDPRLPDGYKAEALVLRNLGDDDAARASLAKAIEADPRFTPALNNLGVDAYSRADLAAAERFFRRTIEVDPQEAFAMLWLASIFVATGRTQEALDLLRRVATIASDPFYVTGVALIEIDALLHRGEDGRAADAIQSAQARGANSDSLRPFGAMLALRAGNPEEARRVLLELEANPGLAFGSIRVLALLAVRLGELDRAMRILERPVFRPLTHTHLRLDPDFHVLLDRPEFAPRRSEQTLIWPVEAPMMHRSILRLFREVKIESGLPEGADLR